MLRPNEKKALLRSGKAKLIEKYDFNSGYITEMYGGLHIDYGVADRVGDVFEIVEEACEDYPYIVDGTEDTLGMFSTEQELRDVILADKLGKKVGSNSVLIGRLKKAGIKLEVIDDLCIVDPSDLHKALKLTEKVREASATLADPGLSRDALLVHLSKMGVGVKGDKIVKGDMEKAVKIVKTKLKDL